MHIWDRFQREDVVNVLVTGLNFILGCALCVGLWVVRPVDTASATVRENYVTPVVSQYTVTNSASILDFSETKRWPYEVRIANGAIFGGIKSEVGAKIAEQEYKDMSSAVPQSVIEAGKEVGRQLKSSNGLQ